MEWAQLPVLQLGAFGVLLGVLWMVFRGHLVPSTLVPRSTLEDVRADRDARIAQAERDRDERIAEAEKDAGRAWALYESELAAHNLTRQALVDQARASHVAIPAAETAVKLLTELQQLQQQGGAG